jgi:cell division septum initiation protein DivIVA
MSAELQAAHEPDSLLGAFEAPEPLRLAKLHADARPNVSGDLPTVLDSTGPMFRRAAVGYDRFQVDTYVQWAEDELVTAAREREHLLARHVETTRALAEARELLTHSAGGGELLLLSGRIGSLLATAADEAEGIRSDAEAERTAASAQARQLVADAQQALTEAEAEVQRMLTEAATEADGMAAEAARIVDRAEETLRLARVEAEARLADVRAFERRAEAHAEQLRELALQEAARARATARDEIVRMLDTARTERRRADDAAAASREGLDREAAARRAVMFQQVAELEHRRAALLADLARLGVVPSARTSRFVRLDPRAALQRLRGRLPRVAP